VVGLPALTGLLRLAMVAGSVELLATAEESLDRLTSLVSNLLDMSRLQAGALGMTILAVGAEEVVPRALDDLGPAGRAEVTHLPGHLPGHCRPRPRTPACWNGCW